MELAGRTGDDRDRARAVDGLELAVLQLGDLDRLEALTAEIGAAQRRAGDLWL